MLLLLWCLAFAWALKGLISDILYALMRTCISNFALLRCDAPLRVYILYLYYALLRFISKPSQAI